jgi:hypothetical protein
MRGNKDWACWPTQVEDTEKLHGGSGNLEKFQGSFKESEQEETRPETH